MFIYIENHKIFGTQGNCTFYKTGSLSEWYNNNKSNKSFNNSTMNTNEKFYKNKRNTDNSTKKKLIRINIIFNQQKKLEISKENENENELTQIEIYNTQTIGNLIKKYCNNKKIKSNNNLYITKKDLKKIKNNLTINEAKIQNNETIYIFEDNNNKNNDKNNENDNENNEIIFNINYEGKNYSFSGFKDNTFLDCIKSFIEENEEKKFFFIFNENIIDKNKTLNELNIKNGNVIRVGEIK